MRKLTSFLFLACAFCVTFEKVHWSFAGTVTLADMLAILFICSFAVGTRRWRVPRTTAILAGFLMWLAFYSANHGYDDRIDPDDLP